MKKRDSRMAFGRGKAVLIVIGIASLTFGAYWTASLWFNMPFSAELRELFWSTPRKMGVGQEYTFGPYGVGGAFLIGVMALRYAFFPYDD